MSSRDALGVAHPPAGPAPRIVSLVPSITELLWNLGLGDRLVGRTAFCIHPRELRRVPRVGGTKDIDPDKVRALSPTHAVVNVDENRAETFDELRRFVPHVLVTHPLAPGDNLDLYRLLGEVFDRRERAAELCGAFEAASSRLAAAARGLPSQAVLLLIWRDPWMTVSRDTYVSRMLAGAGWLTLPQESAARYPAVEPDAAWLGEVEVGLLATEPYPFRERHLPAARRLLPGRPVRLIDGELISWYGSRAIRGLDYLAALRV